MNIVLKDKDKQILYITSFVVIVLVDLIFIFGWQCRSFLRYYKESNAKKQIIATLENDMKNLSKYKQEITDLEKQIGDLNLIMTEEASIPSLIEDISNLANSCDIKITQIKPVISYDVNSKSIDTQEGRFGEIEIQVVAKADFHQLGNFISKLESEENFFRLSFLEIESNNRDYMIQNVRLTLESAVEIR